VPANFCLRNEIEYEELEYKLGDWLVVAKSETPPWSSNKMTLSPPNWTYPQKI
jgi:hypothetical protein